MGDNSFAPYASPNVSFIVKNISPQNKTIKIFNYPIPYGKQRDLMKIPGVAEAEIRASLLKGELYHKLLAKDIIVISGDINLVQFNDQHLVFLHDRGIINGTVVTYKNSDVRHYEDRVLLGTSNSFNTTFKTSPAPFLQDQVYSIIVLLNGIRQVLSDDYLIAESHGPGTGYDTVVLFIPPDPGDIVAANYYVRQYT